MNAKSLKSNKDRIADAVYQASSANQLLSAEIGAYEPQGLTVDGMNMQVAVEAYTGIIKKRLDMLTDLLEIDEAQS